MMETIRFMILYLSETHRLGLRTLEGGHDGAIAAGNEMVQRL